MEGDQEPRAASDPVLAIYRVALPQVYGYLLPRCGNTALAEDLTSETFMAAVAAARQGRAGGPEATVAGVGGGARHETADQWWREGRATRARAAVAALDGDADAP